MNGIKALHAMLWQSDTVFVLTGAGLSTASGIPDFRGEHGLWSRFDPFLTCTARAIRENPEGFLAVSRAMAETVFGKKPNQGHVALARLQAAGLIDVLATQNVDGLLQAGGCRDVVEMHGTMDRTRCSGCGTPLDRNGFGSPCPACGGLVRHDMVLFDEPLPRDLVLGLEKTAGEADLVLVVGSSGTVAPANRLPGLCRAGGGKVAVVDRASTRHVPGCDLFLKGDAGAILAAVADMADRVAD